MALTGQGRSGDYGERVGAALAHAARMHAGQTRKGRPEPYLSHVLQVAALALRYGGSEDQVIAAALHDVPEDCGGQPRLEEINAGFGAQVARMVADCTDSLAEDPNAKGPYWQRKIAHLAHARGIATDSALVAACDKIANLADMARDYEAEHEGTFERFSGGAAGTRAYYAAMLTILGPRLAAEPVADFADLLRRIDAPPVPDGQDPVRWFAEHEQPPAAAGMP